MSLAIPAPTIASLSVQLTAAQARNVHLTATRDKIKEAIANLEAYPYGFVHGKAFAGSVDSKARKENDFLLLQLASIRDVLQETDLSPQLPLGSRCGSVDISCESCKRSIAGKDLSGAPRPVSATESRTAAIFCSACKNRDEVHGGLNDREISKQ